MTIRESKFVRIYERYPGHVYGASTRLDVQLALCSSSAGAIFQSTSWNRDAIGVEMVIGQTLE